MLARGPAAVLVTDGPAPVIIQTTTTERSVPAPGVDVVDTVGAGDAFVAGFLTWWSTRGLGRDDTVNDEALVQATTAAVEVAAAACTVRGANLPDGFAWSRAAADPLGLTPS
jgi:fructokinase